MNVVQGKCLAQQETLMLAVLLGTSNITADGRIKSMVKLSRYDLISMFAIQSQAPDNLQARVKGQGRGNKKKGKRNIGR
jgi:hypothetical protein